MKLTWPLGAGNVSNINSVVRNLWTQSHLVRSNAELILANTGVVAMPVQRAALLGTHRFFGRYRWVRWGCFLSSRRLRPEIIRRLCPGQQVFKEAISTLEAAATQVTTAPVSADFTSKIVPGIDIPNTIQALIARYALFSGDYDKALAAAAKVDLSKKIGL